MIPRWHDNGNDQPSSLHADVRTLIKIYDSKNLSRILHIWQHRQWLISIKYVSFKLFKKKICYSKLSNICMNIEINKCPEELSCLEFKIFSD